MNGWAWSLVFVSFLTACRAAPEAPVVSTLAGQAPQPASALAGAVRALETLDAVRPLGALAQVRALESDTVFDSTLGRHYVRVRLHLTVYAATSERARAAFDELRSELTAEAESTGRVEPVPEGRVRRALVDLDWDPRGREDLVSFSDVVRLRVAPGAPARELLDWERAGPEPRAALETYVRERAAAAGLEPVALSMHARSGDARGRELRCRIHEEGARTGHGRAEIGDFLAALEGGSPAARVTSLRIERSPAEADLHAERGWTFEAELTVHARAPSALARAAPVTGH